MVRAGREGGLLHKGVRGPPHSPPTHTAPAVTHAVLAVLVELPEGHYSLPLLLRDSGIPPQERQQLLNISVCHCGRDGTCEDGVLAAATAGAGITLEALMIILGSSILLLGE